MGQSADHETSDMRVLQSCTSTVLLPLRVRFTAFRPKFRNIAESPHSGMGVLNVTYVMMKMKPWIQTHFFFHSSDMSKRYSKDSRQYTTEQLQEAINSVKQSKLSISQASREFGVPRKTIDDHVKKSMKFKPGPNSEITTEEETALVQYAKYLANRGFPMTRAIFRQFIISLLKRSGRETKFKLDKGPSDKWFRGFLKKHEELTEREPELQDRSRNRMSNPTVMKQYFDLLGETINSLGLKPHQIYNCDETGWSGKEKSRQKVIAVKGHHSYQQALMSSGHVTAHLCICADGRVLPTFIIFEKSLPHIDYKDGVPGDWLFGHSESGYMDSVLFLAWFKQVFIPHCGSARPVLLILDNHDSHTTLDVIECAKENNIELLGLPPHTTHLLQPLDVSINGPLKAKFSSTAVQLGHVNKHQTINKARFPAILSHTIDEFCSPARVKDSFRKAGISPFNPDVIDKSQLTTTHTVTEKRQGKGPEDEACSSLSEDSQKNSSICSTCGTFLCENPLVTEGLIPQALSRIFTPVPCKPQTVRRKLVTEARIITSEEYLNRLREKVAEEKRKKEGIAKRKQEREEKKKLREDEKAKKGEERAKKRQKTSHVSAYICKICNMADQGSEDNTLWIGCDNCDDWVHPQCVGLQEDEDFETISFICPQCIEE